MPMTPEEIARRLEASREQAKHDKRQDDILDRLMRVVAKKDPHDALMAIMGAHCALVIEIAQGNEEAATMVWRASLGVSAEMLKAFSDATKPEKVH